MLAVAAMAPTAGNIGSCGQEAVALDPDKFFAAKQGLDCEHCTDCSILSDACELACSAEPVTAEFPSHCVPLVHDGEVCLDALSASSCSAYESFMADTDATIPTECDFCPVDEFGDPRSGE